jgi:methyl-accepting chemotaxis protein
MIFSIKNSSIKVKFLAFFIPIAILFLVVIVVGFYNISVNQIKESEIVLLKSRTDEFKDLINTLQKNNLNLVSFISNMEGVKAAYAETDNEVGYEKLQKVINPVLKQLNVDIKKYPLHFHKPPAVSFWRIFTKKRNDDLSKFRKTIVKTYETQKQVVGLEHGTFNFGLRSISPIFNDKNEYVGSVEMITEIQEILSIINTEKEDTVRYMTVVNKEYLIKFVSKEYMAENYPKQVDDYVTSKCVDSKFDINQIITKERVERILKSEQSEFELVENYVIGFIPIIDFDNNKPGLFVLFVDVAKHISEAEEKVILITAAIVGAFIIIISAIVFLMNKVIVNPIKEAKQRIINLSEGKF